MLSFDRDPKEGDVPIPLSQTGKQEVMMYAGFWRRAAAAVIDMFFFLVGLAIIEVTVVTLFTSGDSLMMLSPLRFIPFLFSWLYFAGMESSRKQATLGKIASGITVTDMDGNRISFLRATGRMFAKLLSAIPLFVGYLIVPFTKKNQALHDIIAGCLVIRRGKSHLGKVFLFLAACLLIFGLLSSYLYFSMWPKLQNSFLTMTQPTEISDVEPLKEMLASEPESEPATMTTAEYEGALSKSLTEFDDNNSVNIGPALISSPGFIEVVGGDNLYMPIEIRLVPLPVPRIFLSADHIELSLDHVWDKKGKDVLDYKFSPTPTKTPIFLERSSPEPHLIATSPSFRLVSGTLEEDVTRIEGTLTIHLPDGIETLRLSADDVGEEKTGSGGTVTLQAIGGSQVIVNIRGAIYVQTIAYNKDGEELSYTGSSSVRNSFLEKKEGRVVKSVHKGVVSSVDVIVASGLTAYSYPFILERE